MSPHHYAQGAVGVPPAAFAGPPAPIANGPAGLMSLADRAGYQAENLIRAHQWLDKIEDKVFGPRPSGQPEGGPTPPGLAMLMECGNQLVATLNDRLSRLSAVVCGEK